MRISIRNRLQSLPGHRRLTNRGSIRLTAEPLGGRVSVAMNAAGDFVVAWDNDYPAGGSPNIFARRFDRFGNRVGGEIQVTNSGGQIAPQVATDAAGDFVVVWDNRSHLKPSARRYDASGQPQGNEFVVSTAISTWQAAPNGTADLAYAALLRPRRRRTDDKARPTTAIPASTIASGSGTAVRMPDMA